MVIGLWEAIPGAVSAPPSPIHLPRTSVEIRYVRGESSDGHARKKYEVIVVVAVVVAAVVGPELIPQRNTPRATWTLSSLGYSAVKRPHVENVGSMIGSRNIPASKRTRLLPFT